MIKIIGKEYVTYDDATKELLGVSKNTLYRFRNRIEELKDYKIRELIEYCLENDINKEMIISNKECDAYYRKSFESAMIERFGYENYKVMFRPEKNNINPAKVGFMSNKRVNLFCSCEERHYIESIPIRAFMRLRKCPYRTHTGSKMSHFDVNDSLGKRYPQSIKIWSENNSISPYEIYPYSNKKYYWKCENGCHEDYIRSAYSQTNILKKNNNVICKECAKLFGYKFEDLTGKKYGELTIIGLNKEATFWHSQKVKSRSAKREKIWDCRCSCDENIIVPLIGSHIKSGIVKNCGNRKIHYGGSNNPNYKNGLSSENERIRKTPEYKEWRQNVYKKDRFTCQACMTNFKNANKLHAHHIVSLAYILKHDRGLVYDVANGITLCEECHYPTFENSYHNIYGTLNDTPRDLENYINEKRKALGIEEAFDINLYVKNKLEPMVNKPLSITRKCEMAGISRSTYSSRIKRGLTEFEALNNKVNKCNKESSDHLGNVYSSKSAMCREYGIERSVFDKRMKNGWTLENALLEPSRKIDTTTSDHLGNSFASLSKMCKYYGVNRSTFMQRVNVLGWSLERALLS